MTLSGQVQEHYNYWRSVERQTARGLYGHKRVAYFQRCLGGINRSPPTIICFWGRTQLPALLVLLLAADVSEVKILAILRLHSGDGQSLLH
jgi:hypothetical protein